MRIARYLLLAVAGSLAVPAAAGAIIVPQRGMLGASIGMTTGQVQTRLGPPDAVRRPTNQIFGRFTEYRYGEVRISFFLSDNRAFNFFTRGRSARTSQGVGVGTSEGYLKTALRGEVCRTQFGARSCIIGREVPGQIVTAFAISRATGRVTSVTVGRVID